jgi:hypothetical protein
VHRVHGGPADLFVAATLRILLVGVLVVAPSSAARSRRRELLLAKTGVEPKDVGILVVICSLINLTSCARERGTPELSGNLAFACRIHATARARIFARIVSFFPKS